MKYLMMNILPSVQFGFEVCDGPKTLRNEIKIELIELIKLGSEKEQG